MRRLLELILFSLLIIFVLSGCRFFEMNDHTCEYGSWETIREPSCKEEGISERICLICNKSETKYIDKLNHTVTEFEGTAATCTEVGKTAGTYCSECLIILSGIKDINPSGHTVVIDPAVEPTETTPGRTEGKHCSTCGEIIIKQTSIFFSDFNDHERYNDDYAYKALLGLENGHNLADFYEEIDEYASVFHVSVEDAKYKKNGEKDVYFMAEICFSDNSLTSEQALTAWCAYIMDHPIYYWMSSEATYTADNLTVMVEEEYADGEVREATNYALYHKIEEYVEYIDGDTNYYNITLALHDRIILDTNYAYESDGVTPSNQTDAHNIVGVLLDGEGVCESYAKTFQLILNYFSIENIVVTGHSGIPHAWNLVQLDDGRWYWFDLTWDDQPEWTVGVRHNYFCVSNSEYVNWNDGSSTKDTTFLEDHIPDAPGGVGVNFSYALPDASDLPYSYDGLMIRDDIIEQNGFSYILIGYKSLALIEIKTEGVVKIPETVTYNSEEYNVILIGKFDGEYSVFTAGSVIPYDTVKREHYDITEIHIPKTVRFIWDYSFDYCYSVEKFVVDEENAVFTSFDGVLFTKSLYTLIKYPLAKSDINYKVPELTVEISFGAFGDGGNVFCPKYLKRLDIPSNVDVIGAINAGLGFRDSTPENPSEVLKLDGYLARLYTMLGIAGVRIE